MSPPSSSSSPSDAAAAAWSAIPQEPGAGWTNGDIPPAARALDAATLFPHTIPGKVDLYSTHRRWIGLNASWSRIGAGETEISKRTTNSAAGVSLVGESKEEETKRVRALMAQLCESFYRMGWATGTGGGISIRVGNGTEERPYRVFVAPSGLQKEDLIGNDMFELDMNRTVIQAPLSNPNLRQSACTPLWYVVYKHRPSAQAVLHTHSVNAVYATLLDSTETSKSLRITHLEMLKGVGNHAYDDVLEIPIIDNRPTEDQLAEQFEHAILQYPATNAVLVRRHGLYVWGDSWEQCKTHAESIDYLLAAAVQMKTVFNIDPGRVPVSGTYREKQPLENVENNQEPAIKKARTSSEAAAEVAPATTNGGDNKKNGFNGLEAVDNALDCYSNPTPLMPRDSDKYKAVVLDIEGCTTSIAFVKDVLFPYVRQHLSSYLQQHVVGTNDNKQQETLIQALTTEVKEFQQQQQSNGTTPASPMEVDDEADATKKITRLVLYLMDHDVKSATLKELQGQMWQHGYTSGELEGHVYSDILPALQWFKSHSIPVYIYSSGSIQAQKLLFGHSTHGNLLDYLSGHYDITTAGSKKEATSYSTIASNLQLDPAQIIFCSDAEAELAASQQAAYGASIMTIRPGNLRLTDTGRSCFPAIYSLLQLCGAE